MRYIDLTSYDKERNKNFRNIVIARKKEVQSGECFGRPTKPHEATDVWGGGQ